MYSWWQTHIYFFYVKEVNSRFLFQLVNYIREAIDRKQENMRRRRRRDALRLQLVRVFDMAARQERWSIFHVEKFVRGDAHLHLMNFNIEIFWPIFMNTVATWLSVNRSKAHLLPQGNPPEYWILAYKPGHVRACCGCDWYWERLPGFYIHRLHWRSKIVPRDRVWQRNRPQC